MNNDTRLSRRAVLTGALGLAAAGVGGATLSGCTTAGPAAPSAGAAVTLPRYVPLSTIKPDLAAEPAGVLPGWLTYPSKLTAAPSPPGTGAKVEALLPLFTPPPPSLPGNVFWAEVDKRFGMQWSPILTPVDQYPQKLQTTVAGGQIPDIVFFTSNATVANQPALLEAKFADLTPHLSGEAITKYANLANIPTAAWVATVAGGKIFGVPITRGQLGAPVYVRRDLFAAAGITSDPSTLDDFFAVCGELSNPRSNRWAIVSPGDVVAVANAALGTPNVWSESGGRLTADIETDSYQRALEFAVRMQQAGYINPDGLSAGTPQKQLFGSGRAAIHIDSDSSWPGYLIDNAKTPGFEFGAMLPPKDSPEGGRLGAGGATFGFTAFAKADDARISELLAITDLSASTFGTETNQFLGYGVVGTDSAMTKNGPQLNERGNSELNCNIRYLGSAPASIFIPGNPDAAKARHAYQVKTVPNLIKNPVDGLYSATQGSKGAALSTLITNSLNDVVLGRKPLSAWSDVIASWKSRGGDAMRAEYEKALETKPR